ncbi:MAG: hypothetical protein IPO21_02530 [Bacteroidales bacterium]|nr:hypothetical protein [Bacteroidales bacterium]
MLKNKNKIKNHTKFSTFLIGFLITISLYNNIIAQNTNNVNFEKPDSTDNKILHDTIFQDSNFVDSIENIHKDLETEALFEVKDDFGCMGDTISIDNQSIYDTLLFYNWKFGSDAEPKKHIGYNPPKVFYSKIGNKTIELEITNSNKDTISSYISTIAIIPKPNINDINLPFICANSTSFAHIEFNGSAPYTIEYLQKTKQFQKIIQEDTFSLFCHSTDTIVFTSLEDNFCKSNINDTIIPDEYPEFTATISGEANIYETDSSALRIELSGIPPWNILLSDNKNYSDITESPFKCYVKQSDEYYIKSASDQNCKGIALGKINVKYLGYEYAEISGIDTICEGDTGTVKIYLGGKAPWNLAIVEPKETKYISNINTNPYIHRCTQEGIYKILFANDGENKNLRKIGSAQIFKRKKPEFTITYTGNNCIENPKLLEINVKHELFPLLINITSGLESESYILKQEKNYISGFFDGLNSIDRITDSVCNFLSNYEFSINNHKQPSASLKIDSIVEATDSTLLEVNFQGTPPFYFSLNDGTTYDSVLKHKFHFIKTNPGDYTISVFHDSLCTGSTWGKVRVTHLNKPLATLEGGGYYCSIDSMPEIHALISGNLH